MTKRVTKHQLENQVHELKKNFEFSQQRVKMEIQAKTDLRKEFAQIDEKLRIAQADLKSMTQLADGLQERNNKLNIRNQIIQAERDSFRNVCQMFARGSEA